MAKKLGDGDLLVVEYDGVNIYINQYGTFTAYIGDDCLDAKSLDELKETIKRHRADARRFKPLNVIEIDHDRVGRITSRVADQRNAVYFTFRENPDDEKPSRKIQAMDRFWATKRKNVFVMVTKANLEILDAIRVNEAAINELRIKNEKLREQYTDPVTWELIDQQGEK